MTTLKEVVEHFKNCNLKLRLFDDSTNQKISDDKQQRILSSEKLDKFEVTQVSLNELFMTYDIRIKAIKEVK